MHPFNGPQFLHYLGRWTSPAISKTICAWHHLAEICHSQLCYKILLNLPRRSMRWSFSELPQGVQRVSGWRPLQPSQSAYWNLLHALGYSPFLTFFPLLSFWFLQERSLRGRDGYVVPLLAFSFYNHKAFFSLGPISLPPLLPA